MSYLGNPVLSMNYPVDYFTGNGTTTSFFLSYIPASTSSIIVTVNGVKLVSSPSNPGYSLNGNSLNFVTAPASSATIEVVHLGVLSQVNVPADRTLNGSHFAPNLNLNSNTVISVNSSSDALRITQTGAGNALVVEDSANPDSTPFVVDASGRVIVGYTSSQTFGGLTLLSLQINGTSQGTSSMATANWGTTASPTSHIFPKSRGGAVSTHAVLSNNDNIGNLQFEGSDGTAFISAAAINAYVYGTPGTNDMPGRLVFFTTADGASSPTERMRITSAGNVGIGSTALTGYTFRLGKNITGAVAAFGTQNLGAIQSDVTTSAQIFDSIPSTQAAAFTLPYLYHYSARFNVVGAGSAIKIKSGFGADSSLTSATNNFGFYSNIASGTGRYNFFAAGTAPNYFGGSVGVGALPATGIGIYANSALTGSAYSYAVSTTSTVQSDVSNTGAGFVSALSTAAASFTLPNLRHFWASQFTIGAGSSVTNQFGYVVESSLTGATNNYGFYSGIASGTGRYNFYAGGSADNYFAGNLGLGVAPTSKLDILSQDAIKVTGYQPFQTWRDSNDSNKGCRIQIVGGDLLFSNDATGGGTYAINMRITSAGNVGIGGTPSAFTKFQILGTLPSSSTASRSVEVTATIPSTSTAQGWGFYTTLSTQASAFTLADMTHYRAGQGTIGAGSSVTNQYGFVAEATLTGATNNFGFYSNIASGTGRWNFYAAGTAGNYFAGSVATGSTLSVGGLTLINYGTSTYAGMSVRNTYGSASTQSVSFVDFQNELGTATGHFFCAHETDGSSTIILATTPIGSRSSDRRVEALRILGSGNVAIGKATANTKVEIQGSITANTLISSNPNANANTYLAGDGSWKVIPRTLSVTNYSGSIVSVNLTSGFLNILNYSGSTISVPTV